MERLSSGKRIARAADDASGLAISKRLEAQVRSAGQAERNLSDGRSVVRTADAALQTTQEAITRMRELAVQARNGTVSDQDRATLQEEYDQLSAQIDQTAGSTRFADRNLLDGSAGGVDAIVVTDGEGGDTRLDIADTGADALGVAGLDIASDATLDALDTAGARLASERAKLGAAENTLGRQEQVVAAKRIASEDARSRIEDADIAKEVAESVRDRILTDMQVSGQRIAERSRGRLLDLLN